MKEFFARLNPTERRFVVGVGVVFFLVINIVWVWPHFGDWSNTRNRMDDASKKVGLFQGGTNLIPGLQKEIQKYMSQGQLVPPADQAVSFVRVIQNQAAQSGVIPESMNAVRQSGTNEYFMEQAENVTLQSSEKQLVDFLYNLGAGSNSLIRVKALSVQPDPPHQRLSTRVTLVASYQKKAIGPAPASTAVKQPAPSSTRSNAPAAKPGPPATTPPKTVQPNVTPANGPRPAGFTNRLAPAPPGGLKPLPPKK